MCASDNVQINCSVRVRASSRSSRTFVLPSSETIHRNSGVLILLPSGSVAGACREGLSKTRCEYIHVRSAPPSMAPQGFGKAFPTCSSYILPASKNNKEKTAGGRYPRRFEDRKSTRLNSSHVRISYAVFCLKKKT